MRVLVLGGRGFLGRHVALALAARGHEVVCGTRRQCVAGMPATPQWRWVEFEKLTEPAAWAAPLCGMDAVVNCVGILRQRGAATYERVHHRAPAALAAACAGGGQRLVHVSALGLHASARSRFIGSKLRGEEAIRRSGADYTLVRPSLLDGEGGFGARWLRALARLPLHVVPADANGRIAALAVEDAAIAIARVCEMPGNDCREAELGGLDWRTLREHLAALRGLRRPTAAWVIRVPAWFARIASHVCDIVHFSPFSFGHLELLRRANVPQFNRLPSLLGMEPRCVGSRLPTASGHETESGREHRPSAAAPVESGL